MGTIHLKVAGLALAACALTGCMGAGSSYTQNAPGHPVSQQALADEVYLDGTGPTTRRAASPRYDTETRYATAGSDSRLTKPVVRSRPTAIPADDMSASTTGSRTSSRDGAVKPFSDQWWENEKREDARLKSKMNICRGC